LEATPVLTFEAVTLAPEIVAPEASVTLPTMEVEVVWAKHVIATSKHTRLNRTNLM
jgi:hypothetical protein